MQLELKHLAPYLSFGLKFLMSDKKTILEMNGLKENNLFVKDGHSCTVEISTAKPILRPLKDLDNEITHNDKKFYPLACLLISKHPKWFVEHYDSEKYKHITLDFTGRYAEAFITYQATHSIKLDSTYILNESYNIIQKLLEWHFDIFGLIEKGLAISIHDVE
jgi:hypothetical protein